MGDERAKHARASWDSLFMPDEPVPQIPHLFAAVEGIRFWHKRAVNGKPESYVLRAGVYGNGAGAITIWTDGGECEDRLTVNLVELDFEPDAFTVKLTGEGRPTDVSHTVLQLGLFEAELRAPISQGFQRNYAAVWRFKRCMLHLNGMMAWEAKARLSKLSVDAEMLQRYAEYGIPAVECSVCRDRVEALYTDTEMRQEAEEATARLRNVRREDL